ncbi:hypothetical protein SAY86_022796 [Trapa natans]|uniref:VQ domain-containing protein n=1 Tax=Trapa natans TaxID=22666 RepID=A0AAN7R9L1_TRANT|nr:hypothetical protein SAY86_022796 [Trapa natans]
MEEMISRKQKYVAAPSSSHPLSIHRDSRLIAKVKPKIRIIHIFAPEIIKTDAENFRELVQRLTGKPASATDHHQKPAGCGTRRKHGKALPRKSSVEKYGTSTMMSVQNKPASMETTKMEPLNGLISSAPHQEDYLSQFSDIDCFIPDISEMRACYRGR